MITEQEASVCYVTLTGPAHFGPSSLLLSLLPWTQPEWRKVTVEMQIGSEQFPDWEQANLCITAIQELITMADGLLSDDVIKAITANINDVTVQTFRGPPQD